MQLLESADAFWARYQSGRGDGLAKIDRARLSPSYGAYTYKVGARGRETERA